MPLCSRCRTVPDAAPAVTGPSMGEGETCDRCGADPVPPGWTP